MCCRGVISAEIIGGGLLLYSKEECWEWPNLSPCTVGSWNKRTDWKPLPPTRCFLFPLFGFFIPPLAGIVRVFYSNSFCCRTSWVGNGNPQANRRLCVILVFWGYLSKLFLWNHILNPDVGCSESMCCRDDLSQFSQIFCHPRAAGWQVFVIHDSHKKTVLPE